MRNAYFSSRLAHSKSMPVSLFVTRFSLEFRSRTLPVSYEDKTNSSKRVDLAPETESIATIIHLTKSECVRPSHYRGDTIGATTRFDSRQSECVQQPLCCSDTSAWGVSVVRTGLPAFLRPFAAFNHSSTTPESQCNSARILNRRPRRVIGPLVDEADNSCVPTRIPITRRRRSVAAGHREIGTTRRAARGAAAKSDRD